MSPAAARPYRVQWYLAEVRTGLLMQELITLTPTGEVGQQLGAATSASFTLYVPRTHPSWREYTQPGRWMVVGVLDDRPLWAGLIISRSGGGVQDVTLDTTSFEGYLDRRYVKNHTWSQKDEASVIAAGMMADAMSGEAPNFRIDAPSTGTKRDRTYLDTDDRTVLAGLQALMGVRDGPEWAIDPEWAEGEEGERIELVFRVRKRYGTGSEEAHVVFDYPGPVVSYSTEESYEADSGANVVIANGAQETPEAVDTDADAEVETIYHRSKPMVAKAVLEAGWPRFEYRWTPSTSTTTQSVLDDQATARCSALAWGTETWTVELAASVAPRLGKDWTLGDSVRVVVERSPYHPDGAEYEGRVWSWSLDPSTDRITPVVAVDNPNATDTEEDDQDEETG